MEKKNKTRPKNRPYYFTFSFKQKEKSTAILSQIRLIDAKWLKYKIGDINKKNFTSLKTKIKQLIA